MNVPWMNLYTIPSIDIDHFQNLTFGQTSSGNFSQWSDTGPHEDLVS